MLGVLRMALDLGAVAATGRVSRPQVNTRAAKLARLDMAIAGPRPAGVTPEAWAALRAMRAQ